MLNLYIIFMVIFVVIGATLVFFIELKIQRKKVKNKTAIDKAGSIVLFLLSTLGTLAIWVLVGIFVGSGLSIRNWSYVNPGIVILSILGILCLSLLLYNWRRGNFDI